LRRSKKKDEPLINPVTVKTDLEQFLADDKATYEALRQTMFLDPRKPELTSSQIAEKAKKAEKDRDPLVVTQLYEEAGSMAIYEGDAEKVEEYFGKAQKMSPNRKYPILKNTDKAVAKAQEYYKKYLKTEGPHA
jgi:hypothetical protein